MLVQATQLSAHMLQPQPGRLHPALLEAARWATTVIVSTGAWWERVVSAGADAYSAAIRHVMHYLERNFSGRVLWRYPDVDHWFTERPKDGLLSVDDPRAKGSCMRYPNTVLAAP